MLRMVNFMLYILPGKKIKLKNKKTKNGKKGLSLESIIAKIIIWCIHCARYNFKLFIQTNIKYI